MAKPGKKQRFVSMLLPILIRELHLERFSIHLRVIFDRKLKGEEGITYSKDRCFVITLQSKLHPYHLGTALAHELVHVKQQASGVLKFGPRRTRRWAGKWYPKSTPYLDQPWEIQALGLQEVTFARALEKCEKVVTAANSVTL